MPINPYCRNKHEAEAVRKAIEKGWEVVRAGWPDMMLIRDDGDKLKVMAIEVKTDHEQGLRTEQMIILHSLWIAGIDVYVYGSKDKTLRHISKVDIIDSFHRSSLDEKERELIKMVLAKSAKKAKMLRAKDNRKVK